MNAITYHVTDVSNEQSFLTHGALPNFSDGNGQGKGVYVWTTRNYADTHNKFLSRKNKGFRGLIVKLDSYPLNPKDWLPDMEVGADLAIRLCYNNMDELRNIVLLDKLTP